MASKQWEHYLFKKYNLVALDPFKSNVQLFDILVKKEQSGKHPVLTNISSLIDIQSETDLDSEWLKQSEKIRSYCMGELKGRNVAGVVEKTMEGYFMFEMNYDYGVLMKILKMLAINRRQYEGLICEAHNITTESIHKGLVKKLFIQPEALWKPNLKQLDQPKPSKNGNIQFWVVTEIKYCTELSIGANNHVGVGAGLHVPEELIGNVPVPVGCRIEIFRNNNGSSVAKGNKVLIGFKAIRLEYDSDGNLIVLDRSGGSVSPEYRDDDEDEYDALDPDKDHDLASYHMGGLFIDEGQELLECLEIE